MKISIICKSNRGATKHLQTLIDIAISEGRKVHVFDNVNLIISAPGNDNFKPSIWNNLKYTIS